MPNLPSPVTLEQRIVLGIGLWTKKNGLWQLRGSNQESRFQIFVLDHFPRVMTAFPQLKDCMWLCPSYSNSTQFKHTILLIFSAGLCQAWSRQRECLREHFRDFCWSRYKFAERCRKNRTFGEMMKYRIKTFSMYNLNYSVFSQLCWRVVQLCCWTNWQKEISASVHMEYLCPHGINTQLDGLVTGYKSKCDLESFINFNLMKTRWFAIFFGEKTYVIKFV